MGKLTKFNLVPRVFLLRGEDGLSSAEKSPGNEVAQSFGPMLNQLVVRHLVTPIRTLSVSNCASVSFRQRLNAENSVKGSPDTL